VMSPASCEKKKKHVHMAKRLVELDK
jgi:hypothetical protein